LRALRRANSGLQTHAYWRSRLRWVASVELVVTTRNNLVCRFELRNGNRYTAMMPRIRLAEEYFLLVEASETRVRRYWGHVATRDV